MYISCTIRIEVLTTWQRPIRLTISNIVLIVCLCHVKTDTVVNFKSSMIESSSSRIDKSLKLELVPEHSAASGQSGGGPESSSAREIHQTVDVPIGHEEHPIKDIQGDSYNATLYTRL